MRERLYRDDPLSPQERSEYEEDVISFCDRELDLPGDVEGADVLYAGGTSPLWIEGLSERVGPSGSLTVLDINPEGLGAARDFFAVDDLPLVPEYVVGDVFDFPFPRFSFDLVYSSGLFHELDVAERSATEAVAEMVRVLRPGGRLATSDFVDDVDAVQLEDEEIEAGAASLASGARLYGIGSSDRLVELHREVLADIRWKVLAPFPIRHLDKLVFAPEPPVLSRVTGEGSRCLRARWKDLSERIEREGYTRPATLFVDGATPEG